MVQCFQHIIDIKCCALAIWARERNAGSFMYTCTHTHYTYNTIPLSENPLSHAAPNHRIASMCHEHFSASISKLNNRVRVACTLPCMLCYIPQTHPTPTTHSISIIIKIRARIERTQRACEYHLAAHAKRASIERIPRDLGIFNAESAQHIWGGVDTSNDAKSHSLLRSAHTTHLPLRFSHRYCVRLPV